MCDRGSDGRWQWPPEIVEIPDHLKPRSGWTAPINQSYLCHCLGWCGEQVEECAIEQSGSPTQRATPIGQEISFQTSRTGVRQANPILLLPSLVSRWKSVPSNCSVFSQVDLALLSPPAGSHHLAALHGEQLRLEYPERMPTIRPRKVIELAPLGMV